MKHTRAAALLAAVALAAALTLGAVAAPAQSQGEAVSASQESRPKVKRGTDNTERRPAVVRPGA